MLIIIKICKGKFSIFEKNIRDSAVILDFNPFLNKVKQTGLFFHLRAKPPQNPQRWTYGLYLIERDKYLSINSYEVFARGKNIDIPDNFKPSHLMYYPNVIFDPDLHLKDGHAILRDPLEKIREFLPVETKSKKTT